MSGKGGNKTVKKRYKYDPEEGFMPEIEKLLQPADVPSTSKERGEGSSGEKDGWKNLNSQLCSFCFFGGEILCCDNCPASFHLHCHEPYIKEVVEGEWLCNLCKHLSPENRKALGTNASIQATSGSITSPVARLEMELKRNEEAIHHYIAASKCGKSSKLHSIVLPRAVSKTNPVKFDMNPKLLDTTLRMVPYDTLKSPRVPILNEACSICRVTNEKSPSIKCDMCPKRYHIDCLPTPLVFIPNGNVWRCPAHLENFLDLRLHANSLAISNRFRLYESYRKRVRNMFDVYEIIRGFQKKSQQERQYRIKMEESTFMKWVTTPCKKGYEPSTLTIPSLEDGDYICVKPERRNSRAKHQKLKMLNQAYEILPKVKPPQVRKVLDSTLRRRYRIEKSTTKPYNDDDSDVEDSRRSIPLSQEILFAEADRPEEHLGGRTNTAINDWVVLEQFMNSLDTVMSGNELLAAHGVEPNEATLWALPPVSNVRGGAHPTIPSIIVKDMRNKKAKEMDDMLMRIGNRRHKVNVIASNLENQHILLHNPPFPLATEVRDSSELQRIRVSSEFDRMGYNMNFVNKRPENPIHHVSFAYDYYFETRQDRANFNVSSFRLWSRETFQTCLLRYQAQCEARSSPEVKIEEVNIKSELEEVVEPVIEKDEVAEKEKETMGTIVEVLERVLQAVEVDVTVAELVDKVVVDQEEQMKREKELEMKRSALEYNRKRKTSGVIQNIDKKMKPCPSERTVTSCGSQDNDGSASAASSANSDEIIEIPFSEVERNSSIRPESMISVYLNVTVEQKQRLLSNEQEKSKSEPSTSTAEVVETSQLTSSTERPLITYPVIVTIADPANFPVTVIDCLPSTSTDGSANDRPLKELVKKSGMESEVTVKDFLNNLHRPEVVGRHQNGKNAELVRQIEEVKKSQLYRVPKKEPKKNLTPSRGTSTVPKTPETIELKSKVQTLLENAMREEALRAAEPAILSPTEKKKSIKSPPMVKNGPPASSLTIKSPPMTKYGVTAPVLSVKVPPITVADDKLSGSMASCSKAPNGLLEKLPPAQTSSTESSTTPSTQSPAAPIPTPTAPSIPPHRVAKLVQPNIHQPDQAPQSHPRRAAAGGVGEKENSVSPTDMAASGPLCFEQALPSGASPPTKVQFRRVERHPFLRDHDYTFSYEEVVTDDGNEMTFGQQTQARYNTLLANRTPPLIFSGKRRGRPPGSRNKSGTKLRPGLTLAGSQPPETEKCSPEVKQVPLKLQPTAVRGSRRGRPRGARAAASTRTQRKKKEPVEEKVATSSPKRMSEERKGQLLNECEDVRRDAVRRIMNEWTADVKNAHVKTREILIQSGDEQFWKALTESVVEHRKSYFPFETRFFLPDVLLLGYITPLASSSAPVAIQRCLTKIGTTQECHVQPDRYLPQICPVIGENHCDIVYDEEYREFFLVTNGWNEVIVNSTVLSRGRLNDTESPLSKFKCREDVPLSTACVCYKELQLIKTLGTADPLTMVKLNDGDVIRIGCSRIRFNSPLVASSVKSE